MERIGKIEHLKRITSENIEVQSEHLGRLIWNGNYEEALPLADRIMEFRTATGDREKALTQYASNYYSAASRFWREKGIKAAPDVGKYMNTALRALQERVEIEMEKQGGRKEGMIPVSLGGMSPGELDVMQSVYRRAGEIADHVPLVKPLRQLLLSKEQDPIRDFDAAALLAWMPQGALSRVDLIHPDPWPKRRHWKRRFVQDATVAAMGGPDGTLTGPAGALLPVQLLSAAGHFAAGLGRVRALTAVRQLANQRLVHHRGVRHNTKHIVTQLDGAYLGT